MKDFKFLKLITPYLSENFKVLAQSLMKQDITIDLHELESMVNPDDFEFEEQDIGTLGVDTNEENL